MSSPSSKVNNNKTFPWSQRKLNKFNPFPRNGHSVSDTINNEIFFFGGFVNEKATNELFVIDINDLNVVPVTTVSGDIPRPRSHHTQITFENKILVFGGGSERFGDKLDDNIYIFDTETKYWTKRSLKGRPPNGLIVLKLQRKRSRLSKFSLNRASTSGSHWNHIISNKNDSSIPSCRSGHTACVYKDNIYIFGGSNGEKCFNDTWCYDTSNSTWSELSCTGFTPVPRERHGAVRIADIIYIFGGVTQEGDVLGDLFALKITSQRWYKFPQMGPSASPRYDLSMIVVENDKIFICGGESKGSMKPDSDGKIYILDTSKIKFPSDTPPSKQQTVHRKQLSSTPPLKMSIQPKENSIAEEEEETTSSSLKSSKTLTHSKQSSLVESFPLPSHSISPRSSSLISLNNHSSKMNTQLFHDSSGETVPNQLTLSSSNIEVTSQQQLSSSPLSQSIIEVSEKTISIQSKQQSIEITRPLHPKVESHRIQISQQQRQSYDTFGKVKTKNLGITPPIENDNSKNQVLDANFFQRSPISPVDSDLSTYEIITMNNHETSNQSPNINEFNPSENESISLTTTPLSSSETTKTSRNSLETGVNSKIIIFNSKIIGSNNYDLFKDFDTLNNSIENSKTNDLGITMLENEEIKTVENHPLYVNYENENSHSFTNSFMSNELSIQSQRDSYERKEKRPNGARPLINKSYIQTNMESSIIQENIELQNLKDINGADSPVSEHTDGSEEINEEINEDRNISPLQEDYSEVTSNTDIMNILPSKILLDNSLKEKQSLIPIPSNSDISNIIPSNLTPDNEISVPVPTPTTGSTYVNDNIDSQTSEDERDSYIIKEAIQNESGYKLDLNDEKVISNELDFEQLSKLLDPNSEKYKIMQSIFHMQQKLKKAKENIASQALVASQKIAAAEQAHEAAIQEAAYYKNKIENLVNTLDPKYRTSEVERTMKLEKQLTQVLKENIQLQNQYEEYYQKSINESSFQESSSIKPYTNFEDNFTIVRNPQNPISRKLADLRTRIISTDTLLDENNLQLNQISNEITKYHQDAENSRMRFSQLHESLEQHYTIFEQINNAITTTNERTNELENLLRKSRKEKTKLENKVAALRLDLEIKEEELNQETDRVDKIETLLDNEQKEGKILRSMLQESMKELLNISLWK
ncbi:cell end marker tea3 [Gigaspora margarita]|uniref:Cell end marker tea3 n=1 Tax=Gigaspora margarita TaxID=4874 RepID=A0A8H3XHJ3_GIGMA|nr:cell end marker tea3 [Gigaspora margarita]